MSRAVNASRALRCAGLACSDELQTAAGLPGGQRRVGLAGDQPGGAVVGVPVPLVVHRDDVHQHNVLGVLVHSGERDPDGGKHPPEDR